MMKMLLLTILVLVGVTQSAATQYNIAVAYQYADGFTSCAGEDDNILATVTFPGASDGAASVGGEFQLADGTSRWNAVKGDSDVSLNGGVRRLRLRVLKQIIDIGDAQQKIAAAISKRLAKANVSCIKKDTAVTIFLSEKHNGNRDLEALEAVEDAAVEEETLEVTEGELGQRHLHGCENHRCDVSCWCSHGLKYYCQFKC
jgi:hypothetical protein